MKLHEHSVLVFDCYGTLIDWETGLLRALEPLRARAQREPTREELLEAFAAAESRKEAERPERPYPEILAAVHRELAQTWDIQSTDELDRTFAASIPRWPAFPDSSDALRELKRYFKLAVLSNVDRASFAASNRRLGVTFDAVYTAEDIGSYKPELRNFEHMIEHVRRDLGIDKDRILHTAQSLFHDIVPAQSLGLATAWIDRRHGTPGWGATPAPETTAPAPDFHFRSLEEMARTSIREFVVGALNAEMGLEAYDPLLAAASIGARVVTPAGMVLDGSLDRVEGPAASGPAVDEDGDGVVNAIDPALIDHFEFYLLNYFKPGRSVALGNSGSDPDRDPDGEGRETDETGGNERGLDRMEEMGCTSCHVQTLRIERDRRVADVETVLDPVNGGPFNRLFATSLVLFPPDDTASNLNPADPRNPDYPQRGHGSIALGALFNDPSDPE